MEFCGNLPEPKETFGIFLDSGLQTKFFPLYKPEGTDVRPDDPQAFRDAAARADRNFGVIPKVTQDNLKALFDNPLYPESKDTMWGRYRFGKKTWTLPNGNQKFIYGIWISIETNTSDGEGNSSQGGKRYDRGTFYQRLALSEEEKQAIIDDYKSGKYIGGRKTVGGDAHYIDKCDGECVKLDVRHPEFDLDFGELQFELVIKKPASQYHDVDVILDLGNTRTAGLLFDHLSDVKDDGKISKNIFRPAEFRQKFKVLRLKPDPKSGEYDYMDEVTAGIADSWIVLHELEHQTFAVPDPKSDKAPRYLQREIVVDDVTKKESGFFFKNISYEVSGEVFERISQMFATSSPVLLGDAARRQFDYPYTRMLVEVGHKIQQSSPKRFYWDDQPSDKDWCMILNEWDPARDDDPRDDPFPPVLQSEMLRFIRDDGSVVDFTKDLEPWERPTAFRVNPRFPRRSTLTWFLLHILERADSQSNHTFEGQVFVPCRLRKVLMTYPSGWTKLEVEQYRARCQEALDIFSETHVYHGVKSPLRLEMVPRGMSPDEAVAGQLPFVFSEILRYQGQTATDWIRSVGKRRKDIEGEDRDTVRIMNFDIGGGTTDISVIEYENLNRNSGVSLNRLSTRLLFRDGQACAGDDLLKRIIEVMLIETLIDLNRMVKSAGKKEVPLADIIRVKLSQPAKNAKDIAVRSRIVRTCLIPLATYCLVHADKTEEFSAMDAGINENNWNEFVFQFLLEKNPDANDQGTLTREARIFRTDTQVLNGLIQKTFETMIRNCAMYVASYDVDLLVFSGKTSELAYLRQMAEREIPMSATRMIFARTFKPGNWYPFTDSNGFISDAKTVTVVGAALYYSLANGFITNWSIQSESTSMVGVNEWGEIEAMRRLNQDIDHPNVFLPADPDVNLSEVIELMPNCIIARRQNVCSAPEPVYMLLCNNPDPDGLVRFRLRRICSEGGESLELWSPNANVPLDGCELKLCPSSESLDGVFWQDSGLFRNISK